MVTEEAQEEIQGEVEDGGAVCGPYRRAHGGEVLALEGLAVAIALQVFTQGLAVTDPPRVEVCHRFLIESQDVPHHGEKTPGEQVAALGEQAVEIGAGIFESGLLVPYTETHGGGLAGDPQAVHESNEVGVGPVIEDYEAGVDGVVAGAQFHIHRGGVATDSLAGLKHRYLVSCAQVVRAAEPGNSGSNNSYSQNAGLQAGASVREFRRTAG